MISFQTRDSYNNNDGYAPARPRRNNTPAHAPTTSIPARHQGRRAQYQEDYDDRSYDQYPPNQPYPSHRSYTPPQHPRQPRLVPPQNPNQGWPSDGYDDDLEPMDTSEDWTPRRPNQYRSDTPDFDSVFGGDAYPEPHPSLPRTPQHGQTTRPVQQPFYNLEPASEPALGAKARAASTNPFAEFLNANNDSESSLVLFVAEPLASQQSVAFAPLREDSMMSGSSMYTEDHPRMRTSPSPHPKPENLDGRTALAMAYFITTVMSNPTSYRKLLRIDPLKAQHLVEIAQVVLESPEVDGMLRRELVVSIQRFSRSAGVCPRPYRLEGVRKMSLSTIGEGASGTVYRGFYRNRNVCLKALREDGRTSQVQLSKAVAREAILWKQLNHRNILPFYGICELDIGLCIVSPWMRMGDLREYIRGPMSPEDRLLVARDVAEGLKYLHSCDIVHGDLQGKNVLVNATGRARITISGLTSVNDPDIAYWTLQSRRASRDGTAAFQAPEILIAPDEKYDKNSMAGDMYALGCVYYELYIGEEPYKGTRDHIVSQKLANTLPMRPEDNSPAWKRHGLTEKMWSLMEKAWSTEPELRPNATEVVEKLSEMIDEDFRQLEEDEEEPEAKFISRWCRAPTDGYMAPGGIKIPTMAEVEELLQLP